MRVFIVRNAFVCVRERRIRSYGHREYAIARENKFFVVLEIICRIILDRHAENNSAIIEPYRGAQRGEWPRLSA